MIHSTKPNQSMMDGLFLSPATVTVTETDITQAVAYSQTVQRDAQRWQAYLAMLARLGIEHWFQIRAPQLPLSDWSTDPATDAVSHLQAGDFRLYLLVTDDPEEPTIAVPTAAIAAGQTHFYVLVTVLEEIEQVHVWGYWSQAAIVQRFPTLPEAALALPLDGFDRNLNTLLLCLRCLSPATVAAPVAPRAINIRRWLNQQLDE
ncbi:MAG TPA: DUF1822 family protein, partial [Coleofasciculaceae cyanobacterium]